jgi:hypothetical protein
MDINKVDGAMVPVDTSNSAKDRELITKSKNEKGDVETSAGICEIADCKN